MSENILSPSSAARRFECPGSWDLEKNYRSTEKSPHAKEGETAHLVARKMLEGRLVKSGELLENGEVATAEMIEGATIYHNDVIKNFFQIFKIETKLTMHSTIHPYCEGTPDLWAYEEAKNEIYLWDYKFGRTYVEVFENLQLVEYAAGIIEYFNNLGKPLREETRFNLRIVQPRCYHRTWPVREWSLPLVALAPYFNMLRKAEREAVDLTAEHKPGNHCYFCSARHACPALQLASQQAMDLSMEAIPHELDNDKLGKELSQIQKAIELLKARETGLTEQAIALIEAGKPVPGYTVEFTRGRECWGKPIDEILNLGKLFKIDLAKPTELITPKQAIAAGLPADITKQLSVTPLGAKKLAPVNLKETKKLFTK